MRRQQPEAGASYASNALFRKALRFDCIATFLTSSSRGFPVTLARPAQGTPFNAQRNGMTNPGRCTSNAERLSITTDRHQIDSRFPARKLFWYRRRTRRVGEADVPFAFV